MNKQNTNPSEGTTNETFFEVICTKKNGKIEAIQVCTAKDASEQEKEYVADMLAVMSCVNNSTGSFLKSFFNKIGSRMLVYAKIKVIH